jgi:hypothetical protein
MSSIDPSFAYAQPRLQARFGARPSAAQWSHIAATADLGAALQVLRASSCARWTDRMGSRPRLHDVDLRLREAWLDGVDEVASWQPDAWRDAVRWIRWIAYLPALQKLARGGRAPSWMRDDPVLGPVVAREPRERSVVLKNTPLGPLAPGFTALADVAAEWTRHWKSLWPRGRGAHAPLEALLRGAVAQRSNLAALPAGARSTDALRELERRLELAFRRNPLSPACGVAYLGLLALDLRRVRGALATRALRESATTP